MNCKPYDLAIVVSTMIPSDVQHLGKILKLTTLVPPGILSDKHLMYGPWWFIEDSREMVCDAYIKPLRDSDGQDEALTWKPRIKEDVA